MSGLLIAVTVCLALISSSSGAAIESRIINGFPAREGQFPWQAYLRITDANGVTYICGGSLISSKYVLTARHCVIDRQTYEVRLGSIDRLAMPLILTSTIAYNHPNYDIALIELPLEVPLSSTIQPIKLPPRSFFSRDFVGLITYVSGFGFSNEESGLIQTLNYGQQLIISNEDCILIYGELSVLSHHICAKSLSSELTQNVCYGDSGGPMTGTVDGVVYLLGVISFGADVGCEYNYPSGFVRSTFILEFIAQYTDIVVDN